MRWIVDGSHPGHVILLVKLIDLEAPKYTGAPWEAHLRDILEPRKASNSHNRRRFVVDYLRDLDRTSRSGSGSEVDSNGAHPESELRQVRRELPQDEPDDQESDSVEAEHPF